MFWTYEDSFLQLQANAIDAASWQSDETTLRRLLAFPAYRVAWKMARDSMGPKFRDYINSVVQDVSETARKASAICGSRSRRRKWRRPSAP